MDVNLSRSNLYEFPYISENSRKVDLSYNKLRTIPEDIFQFKNIRELYLGYNDISGISSDPVSTGIIPNYFRNTSLSLLDLTHNCISGDIPDIIKRLDSLKVLRISWNRLTDISFSLNMKYIDLSYNKINTNLFFLTSTLTHLFLSNNYISGDIQKLLECPNIHKVDLSNNAMYGSVDVSRLTNLVYLNIRNNYFSGSIDCSDSLRYLDAGQNEFTELRNAENVEYIKMDKNQLSKFPSCLKNVTELHLSNNRISNISIDLSHLSGLKVLDLSNNRISGLILKLPDKLRELYVNSNELTDMVHIPDSLRILHIHGNRIESEFPNTSHLNTVISDDTVKPMRDQNWDAIPYGMNIVEYRLNYTYEEYSLNFDLLDNIGKINDSYLSDQSIQSDGSILSDESILSEESSAEDSIIEYSVNQEDSLDQQNDREESLDQPNNQEESPDQQNDQEDSISQQNDREESLDQLNDQEESIHQQNDREESPDHVQSIYKSKYEEKLHSFL